MAATSSYYSNLFLTDVESIEVAEIIKPAVQEIIKKAGERDSAAFVLWDLIDEGLAKASGEEKSAWLSFRKRFEEDLRQQSINNIQTAYSNSSIKGWEAWMQALVEALCFFRDAFCVILSSHPFPFHGEKAAEVEAAQKAVKLIRQGRWGEAYEPIRQFSELPFIPLTHKVNLILMLGEIQLYHFAGAEKAKELFEKAQALQPQSARVAFCFGEYYFEKRELEKAEAFLREATVLDPLLSWSRKKMGELFEARENWEAAEKWYQDLGSYESLIKLYGQPTMFAQQSKIIPSLVLQAVELSPDNEYVIYTAAGYAYERAGRFGEALTWYDKAITLDASRLEGYMSKGYCLLAKQDCEEDQSISYKEAEEQFKNGIRQAPEAFDGYWGLSLVYEKREQWSEALRFLEESKKRRPAAQITIDVKICELLWKSGERDKAAIALEELFRVNPQSQDALNQLEIFASEYSEQFDAPGKAITIYHDILQIRGEAYRPDYYNRIANLHYYYRRYEEALEHYKLAAEANPKKAVFQRNIGEAYKKLKRWEEAATAMKHGLEIDKDEAVYNREMGLVFNEEANDFFAKGAYDEAIIKYTQAVSYHKTDDVIFSNLAKAWENLKLTGNLALEVENALAAYRESDRLKPGTEYKQAVDRLTQKLHFIKEYGEATAARTLAVSPIVVEVANNLISYFEGTVAGTMSSGLAKQLGDLRSRILATFGITLPRLLFRGNEYFTPGTYLIMIDEVPLIAGVINPDEKFLPSAHKALFPDVTGRTDVVMDGIWLGKADWAVAEEKDIGVWDMVEYPVKHLETILKANLADITGHQEVADIVQRERPDAYAGLKEVPQKLSALVAVCRALVNEEVPLVPFDKIYAVFSDRYRPAESLLPIVEAIRTLPEIQAKLPGQDSEQRFYLGNVFQKLMEHSLYRRSGHTVLAMRPEDCQDALSAVRGMVPAGAKGVLLTENAAARPFIRKLVEIEFPGLQVLSSTEALVFEKSTSGINCIELHNQPASHHTNKNGFVSTSETTYKSAERVDGIIRDDDTLVKIIVTLPSGFVEKTAVDDRDMKARLVTMEEDLFYDLGVLLPPTQIHTDETLPANTFRISIGNLPGIDYKGLAPDEFIVNETAERLSLLDSHVTAFYNPVNGKMVSVFAMKNNNHQQYKELGYGVWDAAGFITLALSAELRRAAPLFQTVKSTRYSLRSLQVTHPQLVAAVAASFREEDICGILKQLLAEEISVRNLKAILEAVLSVRGATDVDLVNNIVFTSPAENLAFAQGHKTLSELSQYDYANAVRIALKKYITYKYSPGNTMMAYLLEPAIEELFAQPGEDLTTEKEEIKKHIVAEIKASGQTAQQPVILTTLLEKRRELRQLLKEDLPTIPVLNYQELAATANIQVVKRILREKEKAEPA